MLFALAVCLIGACAAPSPAVRPQPQVVEATPRSGAEVFRAAGREHGAAASRAYLEAALLYFNEGRFEDSEGALTFVDAEMLDLAGKRQYSELNVQLALHADDLDRARYWLPSTEFEPGQAAGVRSRICALEERFACAAEELMRAAVWQNEPEAAHDQIWQYLVQASRRGQQSTAVAANQTARGWWALLNLTGGALTVADQQAAYARWRGTFRDHPAARHLPSGLTYLVEPWEAPEAIAVLLPLSGPLASAGSAVRDGLISAHLATASENKPALRFYDTGADTVQNLYERILATNADLIIGPLSKANVAGLAALSTELPVVALNRIDQPAAGSEFVQLSLAIEDEAATIAAKLLQDEHTRVLAIIAQDNAWADRAQSVLEAHPFELLQIARVGDATQMTQAIGEAMLVTASQARHKRMEQLLGETLEFGPRGRRDLHAVAAVVDGVQAQALAPALRYHFADHLPIYAGTQALRGNRKPKSMNGFLVTDMPMFAAPTGIGKDLVESFELTSDGSGSLYALGADAYLVADRHRIMAGAGTQISGQTGLLTLESNGQVVRQQSWSRMVDGQPQQP